jgi:nucleoside-diphosphate-sugar epimerase
MKIGVIGESGLVGSRVVRRLASHGHAAVAASPATGVDAITGDGLADVMAGADVVVERTVLSDRHARYFGSELEDGELTTGDGARVATTGFDTRLAVHRQAAAR